VVHGPHAERIGDDFVQCQYCPQVHPSDVQLRVHLRMCGGAARLVRVGRACHLCFEPLRQDQGTGTGSKRECFQCSEKRTRSGRVRAQ
jgi:hypothetical protein